MKTIRFISIFFITAAFVGCTMGVNKDLLSGLTTTNKTLSMEESYVKLDEQKITDGNFESGKQYDLVLLGVKGFKEKDGMVYLGASMQVIDKDGTAILNEDDLFAAYDATGVSPTDAETIRLTLLTGSPMVKGVKYTWKMRVWDKGGDGEITAEMDFKIK